MAVARYTYWLGIFWHEMVSKGTVVIFVYLSIDWPL